MLIARRDLLLAALVTSLGPRKKTAPMPVLFVGHGSPMNAIEDNPWSRGFEKLGRLFEAASPRAILAVSAHWYGPGIQTTAAPRPETIHDFGGFPEALYKVAYPAPGDPALARRVAHLAGHQASPTTEWGLDHGTWTVLVHVAPAAEVPVVQLRIDRDLAPAEHLALGRALAPLRDEGVLILASGNMTHNLRQAFTAAQKGDTTTPDWAARFDESMAVALVDHDHATLTSALSTADGKMCHPTPDHYLPLLYAAGASKKGESVRFPIEGFDLGSLSMRAVLFG